VTVRVRRVRSAPIGGLVLAVMHVLVGMIVVLMAVLVRMSDAVEMFMHVLMTGCAIVLVRVAHDGPPGI
jgi:hypothetical protein